MTIPPHVADDQRATVFLTNIETLFCCDERVSCLFFLNEQATLATRDG